MRLVLIACATLMVLLAGCPTTGIEMPDDGSVAADAGVMNDGPAHVDGHDLADRPGAEAAELPDAMSDEDAPPCPCTCPDR